MFSRLGFLKKFFKTIDDEVTVASATYSTMNRDTGATSEYNMSFTRVDTKSIRFPKLWVSQYWCEVSSVNDCNYVKFPIVDVVTPHYLIIQKYLDLIGDNTNVNIDSGVMWWKFNNEVHSTLVDGDGVDGYNFTKNDDIDVNDMFPNKSNYDLDTWDNHGKSVTELSKKLKDQQSFTTGQDPVDNSRFNMCVLHNANKIKNDIRKITGRY